MPSDKASSLGRIRRLRTDAARTRAALLDAAADVFGEQGMNASVAEVAARAGIAKGTLFGHFPTKESLVAALVATEVDSLVAASERLRDSPDPDAALLAFMSIQVDRYATNRALVEALRVGSASGIPAVQTEVERLAAAAQPLVESAHVAGTLIRTLSARDVVMLACGAYNAAAPLLESDPRACDRYLRVIFDGMTTPTPRPCDGTAPLA